MDSHQEQFSIKCSNERNSKRYKDAVKHLKAVIWGGYVPTLRTIAFATTRGSEIYDEFISIRMIDMFLESAVGIIYLAEEGFVNQAKRELRFILEAALKFWHLDQVMMSAKFGEKMAKYSEILPRSSLDFVGQMKIDGIADREEFRSITIGLYRELCKYVHASESQSKERLRKSAEGAYLGFVSAKEIESLCKLQ